MDHGEATRQMMTERYLLGELTPPQRDEFEEHFFSCEECALDVRAGANFLDHSKAVLAASAGPVAVERVRQTAPWWQTWSRPAITVPAMAVLVAAIALQTFVVYPRLKREAAASGAPRILPALSLISVATRGGDKAVLHVHQGEPFLLFVDVPAENRFSSYVAELRGPAGDAEWSLPVPAELIRDTLSIRAPGRDSAGVYTLVVRGTDSHGQSSELARFPFELQFPK